LPLTRQFGQLSLQSDVHLGQRDMHQVSKRALRLLWSVQCSAGAGLIPRQWTVERLRSRMSAFRIRPIASGRPPSLARLESAPTAHAPTSTH
jgi:hypothetical protein